MGKKSLTLFVLCVGLALLLLVGCGAKPVQSDVTEEEQNASVDEDAVYVTLYLSDEFGEIEMGPEDGQKEENGAQDNMTAAIVTSVDKESLSAQTIVEEYNRLVLQAAYGAQLTVNDVQEGGHQVKVDFDSKSVEALGIEEGYEGQLFYNLARSIDDNLGDIDDIYFTMDGGKDFTLGHLWFEADRPFYSGIAPLEGEETGSSEVGPE